MIFNDGLHFSHRAMVVGIVMLAVLAVGIAWLFAAQALLRRRLRARGELPPRPRRRDGAG